jgi:hypothetical protein
MSRNSARISRPTCARRRASALASVVARPCFQCSALSLARPSGVFAPVDFPPCIRHRCLPAIAGFLQGVPARVLAPQRVPGQSGPNCQCRAASSNVISMCSPPSPRSSKVRGPRPKNHPTPPTHLTCGPLIPAPSSKAQAPSPTHLTCLPSIQGPWAVPHEPTPQAKTALGPRSVVLSRNPRPLPIRYAHISNHPTYATGVTPAFCPFQKHHNRTPTPPFCPPFP